jgi:AcrR family transcriptional regulator
MDMVNARATRKSPRDRTDTRGLWRRQGAAARDLKRDAMIDTAARAFSRNGYHNTSLDDVAAELRVSKPTLYYYFRNKEQLLFECILTGLEPVRAAFHDMDDAKRCAHDRLVRVLLRYAEAIASDRGWCMVRSEDLNLKPELHAKVKSVKSEIDQNMRRLLREGVEDGSISPCDPKMTAFALAGALNWIAHWYRAGKGLKPAEIARVFVALFDDGLRPRQSGHG